MVILIAGTMDTWLIWKLTGGKVHATDYTNVEDHVIQYKEDLCWDEEVLKELNIPCSLLPEVRSSSGFFGVTDPEFFGREIPITGAAGISKRHCSDRRV